MSTQLRPSPARSGYRDDIAAWAKEQASLLRAGNLHSIDVENIAEEIESLARSDRYRLRSHCGTIIEHLLKLMKSPAHEPRRGWIETIVRTRQAIRMTLDDSPSLQREMPDLIEAAKTRGTAAAEKALTRYGELEAATRDRLLEAQLSPDQILGDWFPDV